MYGITWSHDGEAIAQTSYVFDTVEAAREVAMFGPQKADSTTIVYDHNVGDWETASWAEITTDNGVVWGEFSIKRNNN